MLLTVFPVTASDTAGEATAPDAAVMLVLPAFMPVAIPLALMVAAAGLLELKVNPLGARAALVPSVYVHMAVYCCVAPARIFAVGGDNAIAETAAAETVIPVELATVVPVTVALTVALPVATAVANPVLLTMESADGLVELHTAAAVMSPVVPLL